MAANEENIILKGYFQRSLPVILGAGFLGIALILTGIYLYFTEKGNSIALYPLLSGFIPLIISVALFLRSGTLYITDSHLVARRKIGGNFRHHLVLDVGFLELRDVTDQGTMGHELVLHSPKNKEMETIREITPKRFPVILWMYFHHGELLSPEIIEGLRKRKVRGVRLKKLPWVEVGERKVSRGKQVLLKDSGFAIWVNGICFYLPEEESFRFPEHDYEGLSPLGLPAATPQLYVPHTGVLPLRQFCQIILREDFPPEKLQHTLEILCGTHHGTAIASEALPKKGTLSELAGDHLVELTVA